MRASTHTQRINTVTKGSRWGYMGEGESRTRPAKRSTKGAGVEDVCLCIC